METHSNILTIIAVELGFVCLIGIVQLAIYTHCNNLVVQYAHILQYIVLSHVRTLRLAMRFKNLKKKYAKQVTL